MWDQLPKMVQVTNTAFKKIKVKEPYLLTNRQSTNTGFLTYQTFLPPDGFWIKERVPTLLPLPGVWVEKLIEKLKPAAYMINLINNKIVFDTK